jgi:hypothetical protein
MTCSCRKSIEQALVSARSRGRIIDAEQERRLESFRRNMVEGAHELIARHIYKAGVYFASLDHDLERRPSTNQVRMALEKRLMSMNAPLRKFVQENMHLVERQRESVDHDRLLRGILRHGSKAVGLLEGNGRREMEQAEKILVRLEKLEQYLASWRQGILGESRIEAVEISDIHS